MFEIELNSDDRVTYVPDFRNNRELAEKWIEEGEDGPMPFFWVELLPLSGRDLAQATGRVFARSKGSDFMRGAERVLKRIIGQYVPTVGGIVLKDPDAKLNHTPENGRELYDVILSGFPELKDIIDDIYERLKGASGASEGDLKKLRLRFGGSTQPTISNPQPAGGVAPSATQTSKPSPGTHQSLNYGSPATATD